jgi:hypothetical protein
MLSNGETLRMPDLSVLYKLSKLLTSGQIGGYRALFRSDAIIDWDNNLMTVEEARQQTEAYIPAEECSFTPATRRDLATVYVECGDMIARYPGGRVFNGFYIAVVEEAKIVALSIRGGSQSLVGQVTAIRHINKYNKSFYQFDLIGAQSPNRLRIIYPAANTERPPLAGERVEISSFSVRGGPGAHQHNEIEAIHMNFI